MITLFFISFSASSSSPSIPIRQPTVRSKLVSALAFGRDLQSAPIPFSRPSLPTYSDAGDSPPNPNYLTPPPTSILGGASSPLFSHKPWPIKGQGEDKRNGIRYQSSSPTSSSRGSLSTELETVFSPDPSIDPLQAHLGTLSNPGTPIDIPMPLPNQPPPEGLGKSQADSFHQKKGRQDVPSASPQSLYKINSDKDEKFRMFQQQKGFKLVKGTDQSRSQDLTPFVRQFQHEIVNTNPELTEHIKARALRELEDREKRKRHKIEDKIETFWGAISVYMQGSLIGIKTQERERQEKLARIEKSKNPKSTSVPLLPKNFIEENATHTLKDTKSLNLAISRMRKIGFDQEVLDSVFYKDVCPLIRNNDLSFTDLAVSDSRCQDLAILTLHYLRRYPALSTSDPTDIPVKVRNFFALCYLLRQHGMKEAENCFGLRKFEQEKSFQCPYEWNTLLEKKSSIRPDQHSALACFSVFKSIISTMTMTELYKDKPNLEDKWKSNTVWRVPVYTLSHEEALKQFLDFTKQHELSTTILFIHINKETQNNSYAINEFVASAKYNVGSVDSSDESSIKEDTPQIGMTVYTFNLRDKAHLFEEHLKVLSNFYRFIEEWSTYTDSPDSRKEEDKGITLGSTDTYVNFIGGKFNTETMGKYAQKEEPYAGPGHVFATTLSQMEKIKNNYIEEQTTRNFPNKIDSSST